MRTLTTSCLLLLVGCGTTENEVIEKVQNQAPIADAGDDITQSADAPVQLNGSASYDPDGDRIIFHWSFDFAPAGSAFATEDGYTLDNNHSVSPLTTFIPDLAGTYVAQLRVQDKDGLYSNTDTVIIEVQDGSVPIANAGPDLTGTEGDLFTIDGTRSYDPYSRELSYEWAFSSVPETSALTELDGADAAAASFTADVGGVYVVSLVVDNGQARSTPDVAVIQVSSTSELPPTAVTPETVEGEDCTAIPLDGSASFDPNGAALVYKWWLEDKPNSSLASDANFDDTASATPTFYPDVDGDYTVALTVYDGVSWSTPALSTLTASDRSYNSEPIVDAGTALAIAGGDAECRESGYTYVCEDCVDQVIELNADATATDGDGDPLTYQWTLISATSAEIDDPTALITTATLSDAAPTAPGACESTDYEFQLTVTDCTGASVSSIVTHTVECCGVVEASGS